MRHLPIWPFDGNTGIHPTMRESQRVFDTEKSLSISLFQREKCCAWIPAALGLMTTIRIGSLGFYSPQISVAPALRRAQDRPGSCPGRGPIISLHQQVTKTWIPALDGDPIRGASTTGYVVVPLRRTITDRAARPRASASSASRAVRSRDCQVSGTVRKRARTHDEVHRQNPGPHDKR